MKVSKLFTFWFIIAQPFTVFAQVNLVLNPSFEDTIPSNWQYAVEKMVAHWWSVQISPDYFSRYYSIASYVPNTPIGFQNPRTGDAFAGEGFYDPTSGHYEYLGGNLSQTLLPGKLYCAQFFICRAWSGWDLQDVSSDSFGMYFTADSIVSSGAGLFPFYPQVDNPPGNIISDTLNWTPISGQFHATGNEKYLIIGNFRTMDETQTAGSGVVNSTYYFIDDVSLWLCDPDTLHSTHPDMDLQNQTNTIHQTNAHSSPLLTVPSLLSSENIYWQLINLKEGTFVILFNTLGQQVFSNQNYQNDFRLERLASGIYYYSIKEPNGQTINGRMVVVR